MVEIETFFPNDISVSLAEEWMWQKPVLPEEEKLLSSTAAKKRLAEFRAGRHCAQAALKELGTNDFPLLRGEVNEPLWPKGVCGSISHSGEKCLAIAASKQDYLSVAVDVERDRKIKQDTLDRIAHPQEQQQLLQAPKEFDYINLRALLFGMKECVHKIYYPLNTYTLDFLDVEITIDWEAQQFTVDIIKPCDNPAVPLKKLSGFFKCMESYVYSRICLRLDKSCN